MCILTKPKDVYNVILSIDKMLHCRVKQYKY